MRPSSTLCTRGRKREEGDANAGDLPARARVRGRRILDRRIRGRRILGRRPVPRRPRLQALPVPLLLRHRRIRIKRF